MESGKAFVVIAICIHGKLLENGDGYCFRKLLSTWLARATELKVLLKLISI